MTTIFIFIFWMSVSCIAMTYFLYPLLLILLNIVINKPPKKRDIEPSVTMIITAHNELLSANGELEKRRNRQLLGWMWSLVDEGLRSAVREHPSVADTLSILEEDVLEGRTTLTAAAEKILSAFKVKS